MQPVDPLLPEIAAFLRRGKNVQKTRIPTVDELPEALREVALRLPAITGSWNPVEIYTAEPRNLQNERAKFLHAFQRGRDYQPALTYDYAEAFILGDSRRELLALLETVRACATQDRGAKLMKLMFYFKLKDDLATCDLVEGIQRKDESQICHALEYKYPGVDPLILSIAEEDFMRGIADVNDVAWESGELTEEEKRFLRGLAFDAQEIKHAFEWALDQYGILRTDGHPHGYRVEVDRRTTSIDVRDKSAKGPTVFVPERSRETGERLLALMAHEIEGHARQSWNGEKLFLFGGPLKIDEETLYEGLAMRYETEFRRRYFGTQSRARNLDYYVFAVRRAEMGGTFADVFRDQLDKRLRMALRIPLHTDFSYAQVRDQKLLEQAMDRAWGGAYRVMRGHTDMANPRKFAMAKDLAYFRGWVLDQQLRRFGHGHVNEASICSIGQLRVLAEFDISEESLSAPFKDVTSEYLQMLLAKRAAPGAFAAKKR